MTHLEQDPLKLTTEVDWVIKYHLIEAYRKRGDLPLTHPRVALLDLAYHDVTRARSLYYLLERREQVERIVTDDEIATAVDHAAADARAPGCAARSSSGPRNASATTPSTGCT